jgi:hypothetical protein
VWGGLRLEERRNQPDRVPAGGTSFVSNRPRVSTERHPGAGDTPPWKMIDHVGKVLS